MSDFIPGLQLGEIFYNEAVKPILSHDFPELNYSAGLIGPGSEILGYDTPLSMDHHWGPKVMLFVADTDFRKLSQIIKETLRNKLPSEIRGIPTNFGEPDTRGIRLLEKIETGPVNHFVTVNSIDAYFNSQLGRPPHNLTTADWLTISAQKLLEVTSGKVFYDGLGTLHSVRKYLYYYPQQVWLYLLACQWTRISQEEAFVGRCGDVGDELGSQLVASRLVRELVRLSFLLEKKYIPYSKWLGTAFSKLRVARKLSPVLRAVLLSEDWKQREANLSQAYAIVAAAHNALAITKPLPTTVSAYYDRPYQVLHADTFAKAVREKITDEKLINLKINIGSVDQFVDSTDLLSNPDLTQKLRPLFE